MKVKPWFKFDPHAWLNNIKLRNCSTSERGMLIDLMCLAHRDDDYGCILSEYTPENVKMLAKSLAIRNETATRCIQKLLELGRISLTPCNKLVIQRMVDDEEYARQQREFGKSGGNPTLMGGDKIEETKSRGNKEKDEMYDVAKDLADDLILKVSTALGRELKNTSVAASAKEIKKLLKKGVTEAEIKNTITWLVTDNLSNEFQFVVHSGSALHSKWDRIQSSMNKQTVKKKHTGNVTGRWQQ